MKEWINKILGRPIFQSNNKYNFQYRISFPLSNGSYRETGVINVMIPAKSKKEAKEKLNKFVKKKVQVTVISIEENLY